MNDEVANLSAVLETPKPWFFAFVGKFQSVPDAFHIRLDDPEDFAKSLESARENLPAYIQSGTYAVFLHRSDDFAYFYYKTIKYRRKSFALLSDSE